MNYKNIKIKQPVFGYIAICILLMTIYMFAQPKILPLLFPTNSQQFSTLIERVKNDEQVSGQAFWEFREFYSPGYFTPYNRTAPARNNISELDSILVYFNPMTPLHIFRSKKLTSIDMLTSHATIQDITNQKSMPGFRVEYESKTSMIMRSEDKLYLVILFSNSDLQKTNGFLDYTDADRELSKNKKWLSITEFIGQSNSK